MQDGIHLPGAARELHPLEQLLVRDAVSAQMVTVGERVSAEVLLEDLTSGASSTGVVVDAAGMLVALVSVAQLRKALEAGQGRRAVGELATPANVIAADEPLLRAAVRMHEARLRHLVVVESNQRRRPLGLVTMGDVVKAHARMSGQTDVDEEKRPTRHSERFESVDAAAILGADRPGGAAAGAYGSPSRRAPRCSPGGPRRWSRHRLLGAGS